MTKFDKKQHWEHIYQTKTLQEVSWFQPIPTTSIQFIEECKLEPEDSIIDIGGGDSFLVDYLIEQNFQSIHVLDISLNALNRAKERNGVDSSKVTWIESDVLDFQPENQFKLWHDRAVFHFLTHPDDILRYVELAAKSICQGGYLILGTFATDGPLKCSGIEITQYDEETLSERFAKYFTTIKHERVCHTTPFNTIQNFVFVHFIRR